MPGKGGTKNISFSPSVEKEDEGPKFFEFTFNVHRNPTASERATDPDATAKPAILTTTQEIAISEFLKQNPKIVNIQFTGNLIVVQVAHKMDNHLGESYSKMEEMVRHLFYRSQLKILFEDELVVNRFVPDNNIREVTIDPSTILPPRPVSKAKPKKSIAELTREVTSFEYIFKSILKIANETRKVADKPEIPANFDEMIKGSPDYPNLSPQKQKMLADFNKIKMRALHEAAVTAFDRYKEQLFHKALENDLGIRYPSYSAEDGIIFDVIGVEIRAAKGAEVPFATLYYNNGTKKTFFITTESVSDQNIKLWKAQLEGINNESVFLELRKIAEKAISDLNAFVEQHPELEKLPNIVEASKGPEPITPVSSTHAPSTHGSSTPAPSTPKLSTHGSSTPAPSTPKLSTHGSSTPAPSTHTLSTPKLSTPTIPTRITIEEHTTGAIKAEDPSSTLTSHEIYVAVVSACKAVANDNPNIEMVETTNQIALQTSADKTELLSCVKPKLDADCILDIKIPIDADVVDGVLGHLKPKKLGLTIEYCPDIDSALAFIEMRGVSFTLEAYDDLMAGKPDPSAVDKIAEDEKYEIFTRWFNEHNSSRKRLRSS